MEFFKNLLADAGMRLIQATGGFASRIPVVRSQGFIWKCGKPFMKDEMTRNISQLREPVWFTQARESRMLRHKQIRHAEWSASGFPRITK